jgi:hypothetical protein
MIKSTDERRESLIPNSQSSFSESLAISPIDVKENRKFINYLFRSLNSKRNQPYDILLKTCVEILRNSKKDITRIIDEDKNHCKNYIILSCTYMRQRGEIRVLENYC